MAKYKYKTNGEFNHICNYIKKGILESSFSVSLEEEEYLKYEEVNVGILVFERYSYTGGNRLSLHVTIIENHHNIDVVGISTGGSQGIIFKLNTWGEEAFLGKLIDLLKKLK